MLFLYRLLKKILIQRLSQKINSLVLTRSDYNTSWSDGTYASIITYYLI